MKTIYLLSVCLLVLNNELFAQRSTYQLGLNVVPFVDKTVELNATLGGNAGLAFYVHGGYSLPKFYAKNKNDFRGKYWEGKASGAYLRLGARTYLNPTGKFRAYLGAHLTAGYLHQAGKSTTVINCFMALCPQWEREGKNDQYVVSGGITAGVRTNLTPRLTLDLGGQANRFVFEKPDLMNHTVYVPGYGRKPFQGVVAVQYTLKGR